MPTIEQKQEVQAMRPLLLEIYKKYNRKGQVPWAQVFKDNPKWAKQLDWNNRPKRVWAVMTRLRKEGLNGSAPVPTEASVASTGFAPEAVVEAITPVKPAFQNAQQELLEHLVRSYYIDGAVRFTRAFKEHPDWVKALGADTPSGRKGLYSRSRAVQVQLGMITPKTGRKGTSKTLPKIAHEVVPDQYTDGIPHCPECGCSLAAWNRAYNHSKNA